MKKKLFCAGNIIGIIVTIILFVPTYTAFMGFVDNSNNFTNWVDMVMVILQVVLPFVALIFMMIIVFAWNSRELFKKFYILSIISIIINFLLVVFMISTFVIDLVNQEGVNSNLLEALAIFLPLTLLLLLSTIFILIDVIKKDNYIEEEKIESSVKEEQEPLQEFNIKEYKLKRLKIMNKNNLITSSEFEILSKNIDKLK